MYTIYHCHSDYSNGVTNIDSVTKYNQYIEYAKQCGMKAFGFSEHGSVFSWLKKKEAIEKAGMKYIHAEEFYVTEDLTEKVRDNYHCVLIAKNKQGVFELNELSSIAFNRNDNHFYYMPRISLEELMNTSDNIMITTACLGSILNNGTEMAKERYINFLIANRNRCFLEIQHHNIQEQIEYNQKLYELSKLYNIPLIAGTDTHALNEEHMQARAVLQRSKNVRFENESAWDLTFKTYDELVEAYRKQNSLPMDIVLEAIENTNRMADLVEEFSVDNSYKYPKLWDNPEQTLRDKIDDGYNRRNIKAYPNKQDYYDRVEYEIETYKHNGAIDFILLMEDIVAFCRRENIDIGWGRGSVTGSIVCWLLGITEMDSIKFNLSFERFMNTERVSLADIDTDFPPSRRDEVKQYIVNKKGLHCCDIITFNTIALKGAIRDIVRGLYNDNDDYMSITNFIVSNIEDKQEEMRKKYPDVFKYVDLVIGVIVSIGIHPCGMVVSPEPVENVLSLCSTAKNSLPISQLYMKEIDSLNYVKLDLLGLDTIELISNTCKLAKIPMLKPETLDVEDEDVWRSFRDDTTAIFQWESATGQDYIRKLLSDSTIAKFKKLHKDVDKMTLITIGNSAIRPAGASYREDLASGIIKKTGSKAIDDFLSQTFGYLVYQEEIIAFLNQYCGFTMGEADVVRRGFAKKTGTDKFIPRIKDGFIKTMTEQYGSTKEKAEEDIVAFIQVIEDASNYLFSQNHSEPYSYEGYASAWLRYHYPKEFLTAALNQFTDNENKTNTLTAYAKKVGIAVVSPKFRHSKAEYFCDSESKNISKGIGSIKFLNDKVATELYNLKDNKYQYFTDLLYDLNEKTSLNSKQLDILIKIGYFEEFGNINKLLYVVNRFGELSTRKTISLPDCEKLKIDRLYLVKHSNKSTESRIEEVDVEKIVKLMNISLCDLSDCKKPKGDYSTKKFLKKFDIPIDIQLKFAKKIVWGRFSEINNHDLICNLEITNKAPECSIQQKLAYQKEALGYIDLTIPGMDLRYCYVDNVNNKYTPTADFYCIANGQICTMKIHKRLNYKDDTVKTSWKDVPLKDGDVVYLKKCSKKPKVKKINDEWVTVEGEYVWWVDDYSIINLTK